MKKLSTSILRTTRLTYLALAGLAVSHIAHAQAADAVLNVTGTVTGSTCVVRIDAGNGLASGGSATTALPSFQASAGAAGVAQWTALAAPKKFTVGLASATGLTTACATGGTTSFQTMFVATASQLTSGTPQAYLLNTGSAAGVAIKLDALNAAGTSVVQTVSTIPTTSAGITFTGANNTSSQTGLDAALYSAVQSFQLTPIKLLATATPIQTGTIAASVNINYNVF